MWRIKIREIKWKHMGLLTVVDVTSIVVKCHIAFEIAAYSEVWSSTVDGIMSIKLQAEWSLCAGGYRLKPIMEGRCHLSHPTKPPTPTTTLETQEPHEKRWRKGRFSQLDWYSLRTAYWRQKWSCTVVICIFRDAYITFYIENNMQLIS